MVKTVGLRQAVFQNFRGMNRTSDRLNAPPDFLYDLLNGYVKKDIKTNLGVIQQRLGSSKFNANQLDTYYLGAVTFTGSGLDDMTNSGTPTASKDFKVEIDGTGTPDTFKWSKDGGSTWEATGVQITGAAQSLSDGVSITFGATTGHTLGDYWEFSTAGFGTTKKIRKVFETKWAGGSTDIVIRAGTAWGKYDSSGDKFIPVDTGRGDDAVGQCVMFKDTLIMVDGGKARKMDSSGNVSDLSSDANMPSNSDAVWVHRDKVWLNDTNDPMVAYFSKTNSADQSDSWTGSTDAGTIDLSTVLPEGDRIRGFRTFGGVDSGLIAIICDKYTVIYSAGANVYTFTFLQYFPTTCLSISATAYVGNDIVYPSRNELTSLLSSYRNAELEVKPLSNYIVNLWRSLVNQVSNEQHISGVFNHKLNHYYITFPITNNYQTLVYSVDIGNIVGRWVYPFEIYSWCERLDGTILAGSDGYIYEINTGFDDDGTAISFVASFPALYFNEVSRYKRPIDFEMLVYAENADPTIDIDYWYGGTGTLSTNKITKEVSLSEGATRYYWDTSYWDTSYWADTSGSYLYRTSDLLGRGRFMEIDISNSTSGANITIPFFKVGYILEGYV